MSSENEKRRALVAGLREMADMIEGSPWLPVAFTGYLQAGAGYGLDQVGRFAALRQVAELLGADVVEHASGAREAVREFPGGAKYYVHVNPDELIEAEKHASRIVPACEDERLSAGLEVAR